MKDPYETLGVSKNSSADEVKRSYRRLAAKWHPDVNKDANATEKFKEIQEAWEVLSDPQKKAQYDQFGSVGGGFGGGSGGFEGFDFGGGGFGGFDAGGLGDIFESFFGGGSGGGFSRQKKSHRGRDIRAEVRITLAEAVSGKKYSASAETFGTCKTCDGSGQKSGTGFQTCKKCGGTGQITRHQQTPLGTIRTMGVCPDCEGQGRIPESPCRDCQGSGRVRETKTISVEIPPGVFDGALLRLSGKGEAGEKGESAGDFLLRVHVAPDSTFRREGDDIHTKIMISVYEAMLGNTREIETVQGKVSLRIPSGTQPDAILRVRGKGMPVLNKSAFGDHLLHLSIEIPKKVSKKEKELLAQILKERGERILPEEKGFFDGIF